MNKCNRHIICLGIVMLFTGWLPAWAAERVALVIGNDRYEQEARLRRAVSDAKIVGDALSRVGFQVIYKKDLDRQSMLDALSDLNRAAVGARWIVIYYAGHGIQVHNKNYLIPVNVALNRRGDLFNTIPLEALLLEVNQAQELGLVLLDSCRNNPFVAQLNQGTGRSVAARGMARVESTGGNTLVGFSTREGDIAADNGVYAQALVAQLKEHPGQDVRQLLGGVRDQVMRQTHQSQQPYTYGSLGGHYYSFAKPATPSPPTPSPGRCCQLWVKTVPDGARVRVMSIGPKYRDGIQVKPGKHRIRVEKEGYQPYDQRVKIDQDKQVITVDLKPIQVAQASTSIDSPFKPDIPQQAPPAGSTPRALQVFRDTLSDGTRGPSMIVIPAGEFWMGSPSDEEERDDDERRHQVKVSAFAIGQYEVTFAEYDRFCEATGRKKPDDRGWGRENRPVINVNWHDAVAYTRWLSKETGKDYRLPTEAEWEYAARAGTTTAFWWGNRITPEQANYDGNYVYEGGGEKGVYHEKALPVGSFKPNPWGLYDTAGNVWEWTCSAYDEGYGGDEKVCISNNQANMPRSLRGGSWYDFPRRVRSANRGWNSPDNRYGHQGFRLSRSL